MEKLCLKPLPTDPLQSAFPLPLTRTFFPLGFPVRISTNSSEIICAAEERWASFEFRFDHPALEVRFAVDETSDADRPPAALPRGKENMIAFVHSADNFAVVDLTTGSSFSWLTPSMIADRGYFRYQFLEPVVYSLLGALYLAPIHAACVSLNGSGVLLCGDSSAGKTSLAYSCARRGWTYIADDASHLLRPGTDRTILGRPHEIRFRSTAPLLYPELASYPAVQRGNGKVDLEIRTSQLGLSHAFEARADYVVFLKRGFHGNPGFSRFESDKAAEWLYRVMWIGDERIRQSQRDALSVILQLPVLELCYRDVVEAEAQLRSLVNNGY